MSPSHCLETQTATNIKFRFALRFTPIAILAIFQEFLSNSHKNKKPRQSFDYQGFNQIGMTGFEPATTRPQTYRVIRLRYLILNKLYVLFLLRFNSWFKQTSN